jgi:hypothetical protein
MPVFQELVNFNDVFAKLSREPIIINTLSDVSENDKERIRQLTQTHFTEDYISALPQCDCGAIKGEYNIGVICQNCHSPVTNSVEEAIEPLLWFKRPDDIPGLINPALWSMLNNRFKKSNVPLFEWLIDPSYKLAKPNVVVQFLESQNLPRGYINFVNNFDSIIEFFFNMHEFRLKKKQKVDYLHELIKNNRNAVFSDYWPLLNKSILIVENTHVGVYMDALVKDALNITHTLMNIDSHPSLRIRENRIVKALSKMTSFYDDFIRKIVMGKRGLIRQHVFGTRTHFSFRCVISSMTHSHDHDELHIPWGIGMTAFREHLLNKLLRRGFGLSDSINFLYEHVSIYNPLLEALFNEIITESPHNGIPVIYHRNPTILVGSAQYFRITRIKPNTNDLTVSFSILCVSAPNADRNRV